MNKMHTLAKTLITIIAVYWLILIGLGVVQMLFMLIFYYSKTPKDQTSMLLGFIMFFIMILIVLVISNTLRRRDKIAEKIVGVESPQNPVSQVEWIPFAFRLISVIAGMYCFYRVAVQIAAMASHFMANRSSYRQMESGWLIMLKEHLVVFILVAAGIYLLCGAPHFVRWQVRKTIEMCTNGGENKK
ncbi:MAG: hypothetical protein ABR969_02040 [Sedimentisphaerales bacterium]|jgi:hypothetical protein